MAIDDAIDEMEVPEKIEVDKEPIDTSVQGNDMIEDARKIMGNYLKRYFGGWLEGQKSHYTLHPKHKQVIRELGFYLIGLIPEHTKFIPWTRRLDVQLYGIESVHKMKLLEIMLGNYAMKTDVKNIIIQRVSTLAKYEEVAELYNVLCSQSKAINFATVHPVLFATMIQGKNKKALATLAAHKAIEKGKVTLLKKSLDRVILTKGEMNELLDRTKIPMSCLIEVAEKYNYDQVTLAYERLDEIRQIYRERWPMF